MDLHAMLAMLDKCGETVRIGIHNFPNRKAFWVEMLPPKSYHWLRTKDFDNLPDAVRDALAMVGRLPGPRETRPIQNDGQDDCY